ncbi:PF13788 domain protein [Leptospira yanagawae serovar Saopaulo str. Sao Paulo = ATCC 700523]|uniref:PF13788 domain protein n=1 Tax=Leptospira yanagawae serovar Saopaulo str. Sao Paulo = ATCC 700523 TaxID=1249483 RepID=A0A5E8HFX2_9LEPT|nr:DUF4180 domain-containing protein [Leptospira yanagawae]EOQ90149.1 PF13788 domain protein [Leptospira yanagawae serovar Saopaulo str. Sao Paulo = ATCC 700523]
MNVRKMNLNNIEIAVVDSEETLITDGSYALDLFATIQYEFGCSRFVLRQSHFAENFFDLKTGIAGNVLQKIINYQMKLAIIGDFTIHSSKSLKDFIYEMNSGKDVFF